MLIKYITGYAGTGKSTELLKLLKVVPIETVVICPTHKAIKRLKAEVPDYLEIKTIHALLGWIPSINEEAKHINHIDSTVKLDKDLSDYKNIVIDEGGMMSEDMFASIISKLEEASNYETDHITIHVFLDPYQLKPVKGIQIQIDPDTTTNLTVQHRSEAIDIVETYTKFVHFLEGKNKKDLRIKPSKNIRFMESINTFKIGDKLLAYTNACVGDFNQRIAKNLGINSYVGQEVQLGNLLDTVVVKSFITPKLSDLLSAYEGNNLLLQNKQINRKYLEQSLNALLEHKDIAFIEAGNMIAPVIIGIAEANEVIKQCKMKAIENRKNFKWVYALNRAFIMDYSFASTVHKAQGSEYDVVWVAQSDIKKAVVNNYYDTYARLMYVALSRAKKVVHII